MSAKSGFFWLFMALFFILMEAFFAMMEMALVSFNKVRLQYYLHKGSSRARWILSLLQNPSRLFGTILLGVNIALNFGSECSRQMYAAFGLNPDIAPLTQVVIVVIFAELAPLFAARRFAEPVALLGIPVIYAFSLVMAPILYVLSALVRGANFLLKCSSKPSEFFVSREELQRVLEEQDEGLVPRPDAEDFHLVVGNIFNLRSQEARTCMVPLHLVKMIPSHLSVERALSYLRKIPYSHLPLYHKGRSQIVGLISPRNLIKAHQTRLVKEFSTPPWFITETTPIVQILLQFRHNHQDMAVVLDTKGQAIGILTLDNILDSIFGKMTPSEDLSQEIFLKPIVERTLSAEMTLREFNARFEAHIAFEGVGTLAELAGKHLGEHPDRGDTFRIGRFEFTVEEMTLLGAIKSLEVKTL